MAVTKKSGAGLTSRKSVDFAILPPPPKRTRPSTTTTTTTTTSLSWTTKQVIDGIATGITPAERLEAIQKAQDAFRHDIQTVHDEEMAAGADAALTKHLAFLVHLMQQQQRQQSSSSSSSTVYNEIASTCEALEMVYRASSPVVGASFRRMGTTLMDLLQSIIREDISRRKKHHDHNLMISSVMMDDGNRILRKATKILGHFARVGEATKPIAYHEGLLDTLVDLISLRPWESCPWEARLSALWTVANLACNAENMQMIAFTPRLFQCLIDVSCRQLRTEDTIESTMEILRSRSISSRAILNLSWCQENKVSLADNPPLIDLLIELIFYRNNDDCGGHSRTIQDILTTTRRHAIGALRNLAAAPRRTKIILCEYKNGALLDALTDAALNDPDTTVKDRSFATIHNLSIHDTAEAIAGRPALVMALKDVLVAANAASGGVENAPMRATEGGIGKPLHPDGTPKEHASATLLVLERTITPSMDSFQNLRSLLDAIKNGENNTTMTTNNNMEEVAEQSAEV